MYAINIALFNVITEDRVFTLEWAKSLEEWQHQLRELHGFSPLIISGKSDEIGIVTVHEGPTLPPGELIAPAVGTDKDQPNFHNNYQDIEAFLAAGGASLWAATPHKSDSKAPTVQSGTAAGQQDFAAKEITKTAKKAAPKPAAKTEKKPKAA